MTKFSRRASQWSPYAFFYNNKATYLLPRWHGEEGDWQKFASREADRLGGENGDILYARIGWRMHERRFYSGFLRDAGYSWPRMKQGLEMIIRKHPWLAFGCKRAGLSRLPSRRPGLRQAAF